MSFFRLRILTARTIVIAGGWLAETICPELREPEDQGSGR